ncbi:MAG TPA: efflux RND transporter permease subunit [Chitinispirillaceae bacterium]|nr:efflux RND transporter permease subunit [Chitinispirillaceae bacterium]
MFLTKLSVQRPVAMLMLILALIIFGIVAFFDIPVDLMPEIELPYVTVQTVYRGAGPEEIETAVVKPIEEQLSTVNNLKNITSFTSEDLGYVILEFNMGVDPDIAAIDVKDKIDAILHDLPRDLEKPVISKFDINNRPILNLALTGPQAAEKIRLIAEKNIKERLGKISGVAQISIIGGRDREIQVNLKKHRLDALNLSVQTVAAIVASQTANIAGGHISGDRKEYTVRVQGQFDNIDQIKNIGIPVNDKCGAVVIPLHTIADVVDTYKEIRELTRFNSQNSVGISIMKRNDANIVEVSRSVLKMVDKINAESTDGTVINVAQDRAEFIRDTVKGMYNNIIWGIGLIAAMLFLFLGDFRLTIIAVLTIPSSIIIAFIGLKFLGLTQNMVTLMALAISAGALVTNAIIVLDNIVKHRDSGMEVREAAVVGANEVFTAVLASVLTNVAVFLPMANMEGITGKFFKSLGLTIVMATVASLFLSFTFAPMMASLMLKSKKEVDKSAKRRLEQFYNHLGNLYIKLLKRSIKYRLLTIFLTFTLGLATFALIAPKLGMEFFPRVDENIISINIEMPSWTSLNETDRVLAKIEKMLSSIPELNSIHSILGGSGSNTGVNYADVIVLLRDSHQRTRTTKEIANAIRPMLAFIPDANITVKEMNSMSRGKTESDINIEITGDQTSEILNLADSVRVLAQSVAGLVDFKISWKQAKPEIKFIPNRQLLSEYGMNVVTIGMNIRNCLTGNEDIVFREENDEHTIRIQYAPEDRNTIDAIENISIRTQKGNVPVKVLSEVKQEGGAAKVNRKNRQRMVTVMANVSTGAVGTKTAELKNLADKIALPSGCSIHFGGQQELMNESNRTLIFAMILAVILTYMVLAGCIESIFQPILIMVTIPLGFIGVIWALFLTAQTISMVSLMSTVMLIGVVVNNAILIIDYAHKRQREGLCKLDSILDACRVKSRTILMMNLAIVLALLPQALSGNNIDGPFAITAIGGIIASTLMTLFVIPAMYMFTGANKPR